MTDCAAILEILDSHDEMDSTCVQREDYDFTSYLNGDVKGLKVGIPSDYMGEGLEPEVREAVRKAAKVLKKREPSLKPLILAWWNTQFPHIMS